MLNFIKNWTVMSCDVISCGLDIFLAVLRCSYLKGIYDDNMNTFRVRVYVCFSLIT